MSFHDIRLPEFIGVFAQGAYEYSTLCAKSMSGREVRQSENNIHLLKYIIKDCRLSEQEFHKFHSFFQARMGMRYSFRFKDFADYKVEKEVIAIGNGDQKQFQLFKRYDDSLAPLDRIIRRPVLNTLKLFVNETEITSGYIVNNGLIDFEQPLANGNNLMASFDFDVEVRFNNDNFHYSYHSDGSIKLSELELIEVAL